MQNQITYEYFPNSPIQEESFYDDFATLDCFKAYETCGIHKLFQGGKEEHNFTDEAYFMQQKYCILNQVELYHVLQDPIVVWMESSFFKVLNDVNFGMISI